MRLVRFGPSTSVSLEIRLVFQPELIGTVGSAYAHARQSSARSGALYAISRFPILSERNRSHVDNDARRGRNTPCGSLASLGGGGGGGRRRREEDWETSEIGQSECGPWRGTRGSPDFQKILHSLCFHSVSISVPAFSSSWLGPLRYPPPRRPNPKHKKKAKRSICTPE